jgi:dethiobiotin synthetase
LDFLDFARAGVQVTLAPILDAFRALQGLAPAVVMKGVGGGLAPLPDGLKQSDLVKALDLPSILVVGLKLGGLSPARLSVREILADGCRLQGWIGSNVEALESRYIERVAQALPLPYLGVLPHSPRGDPVQLAKKLSVG